MYHSIDFKAKCVEGCAEGRIKKGLRRTTAGLEMFKNACNHALEVVEAGEHQSPVDIIKLLVKHPLLLAVLPLKRAVGREAIPWLD